MRFSLLLLFFFPAVVFAERSLDGFYVAGGGFVSDLEVKFMGVETDIKDNREMVFVGYGKTGRVVGGKARLFAGLEGFYMGAGKRKRASVGITRPVVIRETEVEETVMDGDLSTRTVTTERDIQEEPVETRSVTVRQGETWGVGLRLGLAEEHRSRTGVLHVLAGYARTDLDGEGMVRDVDGSIGMTVPKQDVGFSGYYYGVGYEYMFGEHFGLRLDWLGLRYSRERFAVAGGGSVKADLKQDGVFIGLTGRF